MATIHGSSSASSVPFRLFVFKCSSYLYVQQGGVVVPPKKNIFWRYTTPPCRERCGFLNTTSKYYEPQSLSSLGRYWEELNTHTDDSGIIISQVYNCARAANLVVMTLWVKVEFDCTARHFCVLSTTSFCGSYYVSWFFFFQPRKVDFRLFLQSILVSVKTQSHGESWAIESMNTAMGLVCITSWYPNFNGSHFGLPPSEIHRMTGLPPKIVWTMTYSHRPHQSIRNTESTIHTESKQNKHKP